MSGEPNYSTKPLVTTLGFRGKRCRVLANANCIIIEPEEKPNLRTIIPLNQVISVGPCCCKKSKKLVCQCSSTFGRRRCSSSTSRSAESPMSLASAVDPIESNLSVVRVNYAIAVGDHLWKVTFVGLTVDDNQDIAATLSVLDWIRNVSNLLDELKRPKKLLIFINPFGGKCKAVNIYESKVAPLLQLAAIEVDCVITQRADHARDMIEDEQVAIEQYDGIICVGGDGMFAELLNGMLVRSQNQGTVDYHVSSNALSRPSTLVGVIPAGSTDAVAFGVTGTNDPVTSVVHIMFGKRIDIDVAAIHNNSDEDKTLIRYATSFLAYGFFGDVLLDSERHRWMGPSRYDWAGFKKFFGHKLYQGELKLNISTADGSPKDATVCHSDCPLCAKSGLRARYGIPSDVTNTKGDDSDFTEKSVTISGQFLAVNAATMTCRCEKAKKGMSPAAHMGNGCTDLIIVSKCSRWNYMRYLMRTGFLATSAFELPFVEVYRVREFEFTALEKEDNSTKKKKRKSEPSVWNCDGEVIKHPSVRVKVHCQLLPVFGSGRENRLSNKNVIGQAKKRVSDLNENRPHWNHLRPGSNFEQHSRVQPL
ncbi:Ceramide kinase [Halotydeus destructor]|nr:Ceramide kinase [Halotydeus destructor]